MHEPATTDTEGHPYIQHTYTNLLRSECLHACMHTHIHTCIYTVWVPYTHYMERCVVVTLVGLHPLYQQGSVSWEPSVGRVHTQQQMAVECVRERLSYAGLSASKCIVYPPCCTHTLTHTHINTNARTHRYCSAYYTRDCAALYIESIPRQCACAMTGIQRLLA